MLNHQNQPNHRSISLVGNTDEIDLLELLDVLMAEKKRITIITFTFAFLGLLASFWIPTKYISHAIITLAEPIQWHSLNKEMAEWEVLDVGVKVNRQGVFNQFIQSFQSQSLKEQYLKNSPYIISMLKERITPEERHKTIVNNTEKLTSELTFQGKDENKNPYVSWTLSFDAPTASDAQMVLQGYIDYVSDIIQQETIEAIRNQIELKTKMVKQQLSLDRVRLKNTHNTQLKRLSYSLEIAKAAGIQKPVYSRGLTVKDDPDYSVTLGVDGIAKKLQIENNIKDVSELNDDLQNREYYLTLLTKLVIEDIKIEPFKYQQLPSRPIKKEGPGKLIIVFLAGILGAFLAISYVLLRNTLSSRKLRYA
ncbi:LPS O-antigen length regulator Wzz(fepE) [Providencia rettgeri]|uniref:LPS O-antigen length regulator Wzz(fepE) n=1 Tax=Providencia rettgeri TaxID=587 RepID=UPI00301A6F74